MAAGAVAFQGAVDGGAGDAEQVGQFRGAVFALPEEVHEVGLLAGVELGLLAAQLALGLGHPHSFARTQPDQVGLELGDHRQHVEQQPADRIVRVVHRPAEVEADLPAGELLGDGAGVG